MEGDQMNKNLEELKRRIEIRNDVGYIDEESIVEMLGDFIPILEDFEKRLKTIEDKMGLFPLGSKELPKEQRPIKSERMNYLEKGAQIGKSREGPKLYKSGCGIKPKTLRPKPKPRPKARHDFKIGGTDPD